jgi:dephospho-CoA kinase
MALNVYLVGKAGSGKTSVAQGLITTHGYTAAKFAYPIYDIARNYFGMKDKDRRLLQVIGTDIGRATVSPDIWVRRLMEDISMVRTAREKLGLPPACFVLDDCRFLNEHRALTAFGWCGIYLDVSDEIRIKRLQGRDGDAQVATLDHESEKSVDSFSSELVYVDASIGLPRMLEQIYNLLA